MLLMVHGFGKGIFKLRKVIKSGRAKSPSIKERLSFSKRSFPGQGNIAPS